MLSSLLYNKKKQEIGSIALATQLSVQHTETSSKLATTDTSLTILVSVARHCMSQVPTSCMLVL